MKDRFFFGVVVLLSLLFLALLAPFALEPELYTVEDDAYTPFHTNPAALARTAEETSATLLPLMQDSLDVTGTIISAARERDIEGARLDAYAYDDTLRSIGQIAGRLRLSESEIAAFSRDHQTNAADLRELVNDTEAYDALEAEFIATLVRNDPTRLAVLVFEGEALRSKMRANFESYSDRSEEMVNLSARFELDPTGYEAGVEEFAALIAEIDVRQVEHAARAPRIASGSERLDVRVTPDTGQYGETLTISGTLASSAASGRSIEIAVDSRPWKTVLTDAAGRYEAPFSIGRITSGRHFVYARAGEVHSEIISFTVMPRDTQLLLEYRGRDNAGRMVLAGSLSAGPVPVSNAPLRVDFDLVYEGGTFAWWFPATTTGNGTYTVRVTNPIEGTYTMQAVFSGDGYPLNASKSRSVVAVVTNERPIGVVAAVLIACLALCGAGAWWYLRRQRPRRAHVPDDVPAGNALPSGTRSPLRGPKEASLPSAAPPAESFADLVAQNRAADAALLLYVRLAGLLAGYLSGAEFAVMTPREVTAALRNEPFYAALNAFIRRYELVRYSGRPVSAADADALLAAWEKCAAALGAPQE
ncbi:MAG: Ig-like domain repeat protein [Methanomicrobiaceae archaeon]|nr:Ig-like domain repeat protein [Methanomicrobiaceae archaeon]